MIILGFSSAFKVFKWGVLDCDLAIGLCTLLSKTEVFKLLWKVVDNTWQNYDKIMVSALVLFIIYPLFCSAGYYLLLLLYLVTPSQIKRYLHPVMI